jgi:hypothetical protein
VAFGQRVAFAGTAFDEDGQQLLPEHGRPYVDYRDGQTRGGTPDAEAT